MYIMQTKNKNIELLSSLNKAFHGPKAVNLGWLMKYANIYNFSVPNGISLKKNVFQEIKLYEAALSHFDLLMH